MQRALNPMVTAALAIALAGCTISTRSSRGSGTTVQQGGETQNVATQSAEPVESNDPEPQVQGATIPQNQNAVEPEPVVIEQPEVTPVPEEREGPTRVGHRLAMGAPTIVRGEAAAFWVWYDDDGWHVRTTSDEETRTFRGAIKLNGGEFQSLEAANTDQQDRWDVDNDGRLSFAFRTRNGVDGLDFKTNARCVRMHFRIDDEPAQSVRTGAEATEAGSHLIRICPR